MPQHPAAENVMRQSSYLKIFPDYERLHSAHLQALQGVPHAKHKFASVLTDLIKKPASKTCGLSRPSAQVSHIYRDKLRQRPALCWLQQALAAPAQLRMRPGAHFEMSRFSMTNLTLERVSPLSSIA